MFSSFSVFPVSFLFQTPKVALLAHGAAHVDSFSFPGCAAWPPLLKPTAAGPASGSPLLGATDGPDKPLSDALLWRGAIGPAGTTRAAELGLLRAAAEAFACAPVQRMTNHRESRQRAPLRSQTCTHWCGPRRARALVAHARDMMVSLFKNQSPSSEEPAQSRQHKARSSCATTAPRQLKGRVQRLGLPPPRVLSIRGVCSQ